MAPGFVVSLDYSLDSNSFFSNPTAMAAVDQAAADISAAITSSLTAVTQETVDVGSGGDRVIITGSNRYQNPSTGAALTRNYDTDPVAADTFVIYVGSRALGGSTLGQGGFSSNVGTSFFSGLTQPTLDSAMASYNTTYGRGGGPTMSSFNITPNGLSTTVSNGPTLGELWFDHDTDNDNDIDTAMELGVAWHFDHNSSVASGKSDLYSVALHEILHAIGYGTSVSWDSVISGTNYLGAEGIAANGGSGANLVDGGGGHLASGTMSTRINDGSTQEAVMDPNITVGTRKSLTQIDLAVLRDIGYTTIPEPSAALLASLGLLLIRRHRR